MNRAPVLVWWCDMAKVCLGQGGIVLTEQWLIDEAPAQYLDWSDAYPSSGAPTTQEAMPNLADAPYQCADQACLDRWARDILATAWTQLYGSAPSSTELQAVQAISRMLTNYGYPAWPTGITDRGRIVRGWWGHHNWGAILCGHCSASCGGGFPDTVQLITDGKWRSLPACFKHEVTNERGAFDLLRMVRGTHPSEFFAREMRLGDAYEISKDLLGRGIFVRTSDAKEKVFELDASMLADRLVRHANAIANATGESLHLSNAGPSATEPSDDPPGIVNTPPPLSHSKALAISLALVAVAATGYGVIRWRRRTVQGK